MGILQDHSHQHNLQFLHKDPQNHQKGICNSSMVMTIILQIRNAYTFSCYFYHSLGIVLAIQVSAVNTAGRRENTTDSELDLRTFLCMCVAIYLHTTHVSLIKLHVFAISNVAFKIILIIKL